MNNYISHLTPPGYESTIEVVERKYTTDEKYLVISRYGYSVKHKLNNTNISSKEDLECLINKMCYKLDKMVNEFGEKGLWK